MKNSDIEIDHLLQIVESEEVAYQLAKATGLNILAKTDHTGQGTSGIFLAFEECYFEYIWLRDIEEARSNPLRFDLRIAAVKDGGSPFGVSFRCPEHSPDLEKFIIYKPTYGKYTICFSKENFENYKHPLIFYHTHPDRPLNSDWHLVKSKNIDQNTCNFKSEIKSFKAVELFFPFECKTDFPQIHFVKSETHKMIIESEMAFCFSSIVELKRFSI